MFKGAKWGHFGTFALRVNVMEQKQSLKRLRRSPAFQMHQAIMAMGRTADEIRRQAITLPITEPWL